MVCNYWRKWLFFLFTFVFFYFIPEINFSQTDFRRLEKYDVSEGLSQSTIKSIFQDRKGFIWFGTESGLNRFDGNNFKSIDKVAYASISKMIEDSNGNFWVATSRGLYYLLSDLSDVIQFPANRNNPNCLISDNIVTMTQDKGRNIWISTIIGLCMYNIQKKNFHYIPIENYSNYFRNSNLITSLLIDSEGFLWIGTNEGGVFRVVFENPDYFYTGDNPKIKSIEQYKFDLKNPKSLSGNYVSALLQDKKNNIWIGTNSAGLNKVVINTIIKNGKTNKQISFKRYRNIKGDSRSLPSDNISVLYEDRSENLWIGTLGAGLCRFDKEKESFFSYDIEHSIYGGSTSNYVISLLEDAGDNLWVGTYSSGVGKYNKSYKTFELFKNDKNKPNTIPNNLIISIFENERGDLWIGTRDGLVNYNQSSGKYTLYKNNPNNPNSINNNIIRTLLEDRFGRLWIGTNGGGINMFDRTNNKFLNKNNNKKPLFNANFNSVRATIIDRKENLWIGTDAGLYKYNLISEELKCYNTNPADFTSLDNGYIWALYEDRSGSIWVSTRMSLNKYCPSSDNFTRVKPAINYPQEIPDRFVMTIYEDNNGTFWLGTFGGGLHKIVEETTINRDKYGNIIGEIKSLRQEHCHIDFLRDNEMIYGILPDNDGNLWFSANHGLWKFNPNTKKIKNFTVNDGIQSDEFNSGAYFKNKRGEMYFGGNNGLNKFHPDNIKENNFIPNIVITSFKIFDNVVNFDKDISEIKEINLSYKDNFFSFEFAALDYSNPRKNNYAYKLEGFDNDWINCGNRHYASYTNLGGGEYIFRVKGTNNDGIWNNEGTSIRIIINPPFWKTWWFFSIIGIALALFSFLIMKYRTQRIERRNKILKNLVAIRTKELEEKTEEIFIQKTYFQQLFENTPLGIIMLDLDRKVVDINKSFENIFGYSKEEIVNKYITDFFVPDSLGGESREILDNTLQKSIHITESKRKTKDGRLIDVQVYALQIRVAKEVVGIYAIYEDITERKKNQEETRFRIEQIIIHQATLLNLARLDNSNLDEMMKAIVETSSKTLDVDRVSIWLFNDKKSDLICFDRFILSKNFHEKNISINPKNYPKYFKALEENVAFVVNETQNHPYVQEFYDDYLVPQNIVSLISIPIRTKGIMIGILNFEHVKNIRKWTQEEISFAGSLSDHISLSLESSARKKAEEELESEKERLAVTLSSIGDGVITTDLKGRITLINKVAEGLTEWSLEESIGKPLEQVFQIIDEKTRTRCDNPFEKIIKLGTIVNLEVNPILLSKSKKERIIADSGAPIRDKNGKIIGVVIVFRDITEKRKLEEQILKTQKLESLGILAGGIAHDFNNMLTAILGNVSLAKIFSKGNEKVFNRLQEAEKATARAKDLTQQLLTFSKGGDPIKKITSIEKIIKDTVSFTLSGSKTNYQFNIEDNLWAVNCDEGQISQVISNLVINADQAMPGSGIITVSVKNIHITESSNLPFLENGFYVEISVQDSGVGIPNDQITKIFDPFYTTKEKGRGLGLATVFSIINKHNGYIDVKSKVGSGTTFIIYLPSIGKKSQMEDLPENEIKTGNGSVLVMDDDEMIREFARELISELGYKVSLAKNGEEAIDLYEKSHLSGNPYDVIILDLTIPGGLGGKEVMEILSKKYPEVKSIVSSGYSNDPVMSDYKEYGFKNVIPKPYKIEDLSHILNKTINGN